jgi:hypothetical protein
MKLFDDAQLSNHYLKLCQLRLHQFSLTWLDFQFWEKLAGSPVPCFAADADRFAWSKRPAENEAKALSAKVRLKSNSRSTKSMLVFAKASMSVFAVLTCRSDSLRT